MYVCVRLSAFVFVFAIVLVFVFVFLLGYVIGDVVYS